MTEPNLYAYSNPYFFIFKCYSQLMCNQEEDRGHRKEMKSNYEHPLYMFPRDLLHDGLIKYKYFFIMVYPTLLATFYYTKP